ncbi:MAG TPA: hypothetical protein VNW51_01555 [Mucilaginibacter sp.]|nr:hypothetical protein [Mucilaginibacter sp.]
MKSKRFLLAIAILSVAVLFACKKSGVSSAFDKSYDAWLSYKKRVNNTYAYVALHDDKISVYEQTKITVTNGDITARDFYSYEYVYQPDSTRKVLRVQWHETADGGTLSTHGSEGAQLYTLDDIYYRAQNIWLKADVGKNVITFETNNNGIISAAGYTPKICQTDCFIGVVVQSITP